MGVAKNVMKMVAGADHIGELQAWNVDTGKKVWTTNLPSFNWGPVLATGGDVLFAGGTNDRMFRAFDAKTGKILWEFPTISGVAAVPVSFQVDGKQYIAVQSGLGRRPGQDAGAHEPAVPGQVSRGAAGRRGLCVCGEVTAQGDRFKSPGQLEVEILVLRHQLNIQCDRRPQSG